MLNELISRDQDNNESILKEYIKENNIRFNQGIFMHLLLMLNKLLSNI